MKLFLTIILFNALADYYTKGKIGKENNQGNYYAFDFDYDPRKYPNHTSKNIKGEVTWKNETFRKYENYPQSHPYKKHIETNFGWKKIQLNKPKYKKINKKLSKLSLEPGEKDLDHLLDPPKIEDEEEPKDLPNPEEVNKEDNEEEEESKDKEKNFKKALKEKKEKKKEKKLSEKELWKWDGKKLKSE